MNITKTLCSAIKQTWNCLSVPNAEIPHFIQSCPWPSLLSVWLRFFRSLQSSGGMRTHGTVPCSSHHVSAPELLGTWGWGSHSLLRFPRHRRHSEIWPKCFKKTVPCQCPVNLFPADMTRATVAFSLNEKGLQLLNGCMLFWLEL